MTMEPAQTLGTDQPPGASSFISEYGPTATVVDLYECCPGGDLLLTMSCRAENEPGTKGQEASTQATPNEPISLRDSSDAVSVTPLVDYHFRVSSQCMILASPVFRAMLQGGFGESLQLKSTGELRLPLPDDDPDVFLILLDILHHRTRKVPRSVSLEQLKSLAILIDKYQLQESVEVFSDMWIEGLQGQNSGVPEILTPYVVPWLFISWVFRKGEPFRQATRILQLEGDAGMEEISLQELPFPDVIIDKLKSIRCAALAHIFQIISSHVEIYQEPKTITEPLCRRHTGKDGFACDAMVLGTLLKSCINAGIWPVPAYPFHGFTVQQVFKDAAAVQIMSLCDIIGSRVIA